MRLVFAILSGVVGIGAAMLLLDVAMRSGERGSVVEVGLALAGGAAALGLTVLAVLTATQDIDFRSWLKGRRGAQ